MTQIAMTKHQRYPNNKAAPVTVPKVRLYVERPENQGNWFVHIGHVTDRGRDKGWRTGPHAHPDFGQVIFIRNGRGVMNLEGRSVPFDSPCVLLLPTECVHGLNYEVDTDKWVVTTEATFLTQVNARLPEFIQLWAQPRVIPLAHATDEAAEFHSTLKSLEREIGSRAVGHVVGTETLLTTLFLMLVRCTRLDKVEEEGVTRHETKLVDRFRELIDQHYRQSWSLQNYASVMAVSPAQLRAACIAATGQSPTKMIHARVIAEAKRNLIFGDLSIEQIAYWLEFSDAAYFARFFRKEVGQSPSEFRMSARHQRLNTK